MSPRAIDDTFAGGGEMGALTKAFAWHETSLGPMERWSRSLRTALGIVLNSRHPMFLWWGSDLIQFYNDGYRPSLADRHPAALGARGREFWAEIWPTIGPDIEAVMARGEPSWHADSLVPILRNGRLEEVYWTYGYSPVHDDDGAVGGTLVVVQEQTGRVLSERRLRTLRDLAALASSSLTEQQLWSGTAAVLAENPFDLPGALVYVERDNGARFVAQTGIAIDSGRTALGNGDGASDPWPLRRVVETGRTCLVSFAGEAIGALASPWPEPIREGCAMAVRRPGASSQHAVLVSGVSPRLTFDAAYHDFMRLAADQIATCLTNARIHEEERRRTEALAQLDRAKTSFFSNVSHEFRTPLTLMLGPTEEALASPDRTLRGEDLATVHRNELRLLKLVNTLLEFSRIEAGRLHASYEATDLARLTLDLSSTFRSTVEHAGLRFDVDCPALPEPVHVDRHMWETIVLNLLSNAFKFTFEGSVSVSLVWEQSSVSLLVRDTGVGIPADDIPHIFERFHRVHGARGRSHEGSGIGLALVQELVRMHGGSVAAASVVGEGTTVRVTIPTGSAHLANDRIGAAWIAVQPEIGPTRFVEEARRWLPAEPAADVVAAAPLPQRDASGPGASTEHILVVDDSADMRAYIARLLGVRWNVETVADGFAALAAAKRRRPDLVISDVMMPGLDGFELLSALRGADDTRTVPIILLTARAGEGAQIDAWNAGADDYLVKPFSARDLVARVQAQLLKGHVRAVEALHARRLDGVFKHAPVGIAILRGPDHVYEFANPPYLELLSHRGIIGKPIREAVPEVVGQGLVALLDGAYASGVPYIGRSVRLVLNRGANDAAEEAFFDFVCQPTFDDGGQVDGIAAVIFEVTELARARAEAEAANRIKDLALDTGQLGSWHIDLRTRERWNSSRCKANFGRTADEPLTYDDVIRAIHPDDRDRVAATMASAIADHADYAAEYRVVWPDGSMHWLFARGRTMYADNGEPLHMAGNTLDVTEQKRLVSELETGKHQLEQRVADRTAALTAANAELASALAERATLERARDEWLRTLMTAQEDERRRIARELHDELGQHLTGLTLGLHALLQSSSPGREVWAERLQQLVGQINQSVRHIAQDLRPPALDDLGLVTALTAHIDEWSLRTSIPAHFSHRNCESLPPLVETTLYRVVQEGLTNVARHSQARTASVVVDRDGDQIVAVIEDDGKGFDSDAALRPDATGHWGLIGIRERAALLGGTMAIESTPGSTSVFVTLPIPSSTGTPPVAN